VEIRPVKGQVDDLLEEIRVRSEKNERVLVTTLTKRMAEDLSEYFSEIGVKCRYLHSEVETLDRIRFCAICGAANLTCDRHQSAPRRTGPSGSVAGGDFGCR